MKYKSVVWDWNGTLLDDAAASLGSVNEMLETRGKSAIGMDYYRECMDVPIIGFYERVFGYEVGDYSLLVARYNEGYLRRLADCGLTRGAREALENFSRKGIGQILVSSTNGERLGACVRRYGISEYFDAVLGADDDLAGSKIERTVDYIQKNNLESASLLVVGDLEHDAELAERLGADCALLTSGHECFSRLKATKAVLIDDLFALIDFVENS